MSFREIDPRDMENVVKMIGDDWALITAEKENGDVNTMTASWGFMGVLWHKPVCAIVIRPQRYTLEFVESAERLSLSFFDESYRPALRLCGTKSGRDMDKIGEAGLTVRHTEANVPYFKEAKTVVVCRKLYADDLKPECFIDPSVAEKNYPAADYHRVFICEIEQVLEKE
ncbi:MAG: flavin reductase [Clostridia bacterium]|nr:flavin reductase [Clostridia bacterium]